MNLDLTAQTVKYFPVLKPFEWAALLNPKNKECKFHDYIGNKRTKQAVLTLIGSAFGMNYDMGDRMICTREMHENIALVSEASGGKTDFWRRVRDTLELPHLEIDGSESGLTIDKLVERMETVLDDAGIPLVPVGHMNGEDIYYPPPMLWFIDEVHNFAKTPSGRVIAQRLLKMVEGKDRTLITAKGRFDCRRIGLVIATNRWGELDAAFKTRFTKLRLDRHTRDDLVQIVQANNPKFPLDICQRIADYTGLARKAITFAEWVRQAQSTHGITLEAAVEDVADQMGCVGKGIDRLGLDALRALDNSGDGGLSQENLVTAIGCDVADWKEDVKPQLGPNIFHGPLVEVARRHVITAEGRTILADIERSLLARA